MTRKLKITIGAVSIAFVCAWFLGILFFYFLHQIIVKPVLDVLDYPVHELKLQGSANGGQQLSLLGLQMQFPPAGMQSRSAVPFFKDHRIEMVSVFLNAGEEPAGNLIVSAYPDTVLVRTSITPPVSRMTGRFLCGSESASALIKAIHEAKVEPFPWWNLVGAARHTGLLYLKSLMTATWYREATFYHVETGNLSGFLAEGKYGKERKITQLTFGKDGTLYEVLLLDRTHRDFKDFLSTIRFTSATGAQKDFDKQYPGISRDAVLLSRLTSTVTVPDLEELVRLTEARKKAGEKTVQDVQPLQAELEYVKGHRADESL